MSKKSGSDLDKIRMCIDRVIEEKHLVKHAKKAVKEEPGNFPLGLGAATPLAMAILTSKRWQNGRTLRVAFMDGPETYKSMVRKCMPEWSVWANIGFDFRQDQDAEIRVSFAHPGAWAYIGTDALGIDRKNCTCNFGFIDESVILHEAGHVIGCTHEHLSPAVSIPWARDKVIAYYSGPPNNWSVAQIENNIFRKYDETLTQHTFWDRNSIMEYPIDANLLTDPKFAVGWNRFPSLIDQQFIATIYPKTAPVVPPPAPAVPAAMADSLVEIPLHGTYRVVQKGKHRSIVLN